MVNIDIAPGQTVETTDPHVRVKVTPIPPLTASAYKVVLVVRTNDGRQSLPVELPLIGAGPVPE
jgi:hypothetical protein